MCASVRVQTNQRLAHKNNAPQRHKCPKIPQATLNTSPSRNFCVSLCTVLTLKRSNSNKDKQDPTCDHGGSSQRTHVVMTGITRNWLQTSFQGTSDNLRSFIATTDTTTIFTLTSRMTRHPASKTKAEEGYHWHFETNTHILCTHARKHRKAGEREWEVFVTCEKEEVVSKRWGRCAKQTSDSNQEAIEGECKAKTNVWGRFLKHGRYEAGT